ncbi:MAG: ABC transporter substrate-binding protein [Marmoricola sp.]
MRSWFGEWHRPTRLVALGTAAVLVPATLTGCGSGPGSSSSGKTVRLVYDWPTIDFEAVPFVVGQKQGFYDRQGIHLKLVLPPDNATTVKMLAVGKGDIGFDTTSDVAFARAAGIPIVSIGNYSQTNNWGLVTKPGEPVKMGKLAGAKIGVFTDSWTKAMMPYVLRAGKVSAAQVDQIIFQSNDLSPMLAGKIDIATNTTNYAIAQVQSATGKRPETMTATKFGAPNVPIWAYTATSSWLKQNPKKARAFLAATRQATAWAIAHPRKAVREFVAAYPDNGSSARYNQLGWTSTIPYLKDSRGRLLVQRKSQWTQLVKALDGVKLLKKSFKPSTYYTNRYLP